MTNHALIKYLRGFNTLKFSKFFLLTVFFSVSTILTGCGGGNTAPNAETTTETPTPTQTVDQEKTPEATPKENTDTEETPEATGSVNDQYISYLNELLTKVEDEKLNTFAQETTEEEAIEDAQFFCQSLDDGTSIDAMIQSIQDDADNEELSPEEQETLGSYLALVMIAGTKYYCPRHQEAVNKFFNS